MGGSVLLLALTPGWKYSAGSYLKFAWRELLYTYSQSRVDEDMSDGYAGESRGAVAALLKASGNATTIFRSTY